ncbi:aminotransferase class V-fold PLP-dependent enzyme [Actinacidiphila epipremni]|uniref:Aminotransferase class V-fold PLP-dependent enzyme n=1 Tax=Actinacidiphila epipremni TaxID=2053013 RepID=A0ABX0ZYR4_9ACTN|nr:aminotransferase class V-fold PLP-dependent enzyme [Actinacidiphila epipremni]NJP48047.1 aminotransferase class V-fold PLP-dependent enzyme [Actinacidiphila epipremni]
MPTTPTGSTTATGTASATDSKPATTSATSGVDATGTTGLAPAEYRDLAPGYLNTATLGIAPARATAAVHAALDDWSAGRPATEAYEEAVAAARAAFARIVNVPVTQVALAGTVAGAVGLIAAALPPGAEVVTYEADFSALVHPFAARPDLDLRLVPLEAVADAVRPTTALVAVSSVQSADGRIADLAAIRAAAAAHGARTLIDATQSAGWLPLDASLYDYVVCHGYKWLTSPHGAAFLTVAPDAESTLAPTSTGWYAAADPYASPYGPITTLAPGARRFDARPSALSFVAAAQSLALIEELTIPRIHAHTTALATRLRTGLTALGHHPLPTPSAIVAVPDAPTLATRLAATPLTFSTRANNLRFAPHFYNSEADIDALLNAAS